MNIARPAAFSLHHAAGSAPAIPGRPTGNGVAPDDESIRFVAELANDPLGIVASYLPQSDQLRMRQVGDPVRSIIDDQMRCLTVTARQAGDLLLQPDAFRHLEELRLTDCDDAELAALAAVLRDGTRPPFTLVLDGEAGATVCAAGYRAIAPLPLSGIVLRGMAVPRDAAVALSETRIPVSISLPPRYDADSDAYCISQIPSLTSLSTGRESFSQVGCIEALASHPRLTSLRVNALTPDALQTLARGPRLQSLAVEYLYGGERGPAFAALASSVTLTSLAIGTGIGEDDMAALARSRTLNTLTLDGLRAGAARGFPALAAMPALDHLTVRGWGERVPVPVTAEEIAAVCAKPLKSLSLDTLSMNAAAFGHVATTRAQSLAWQGGRMFGDAEAAMLAGNPRVSSLSLGSGMVTERGALLLARAPGLRRLELCFPDSVPMISVRRLTDAWMAGRKSYEDLHVAVEDGVASGAVPPWA